jgi:rhomboid family GlyGly-CTERM serine protease
MRSSRGAPRARRDSPLRGAARAPWISFVLATLSTLLYWCGGGAPEALVFDRDGIAGGEFWRLVTGHWVHSDAQHAVWNIAALAVLGTLFESRLRWRLPAALLAGSAAIDGWMWWCMPGLARYCGLSGILNALLAVGLMQLWREQRDPLVVMVATGAVLKLVVEGATGTAVFTQTAWRAVPAVHAIGLAAGALLAISTAHAAERLGPAG